MARNPEIRYIQYYADGSAARQFELPLLPQKQTPQPRRRKQKKTVLRVDFVALLGIVVAAVMLILMMVGMAELNAVNDEVASLENYISELENENILLENTYREGYVLDEVRAEALEMGMVPADQAQTVTIPLIHATMAEEPENHSFWTFLTGLFA